MLRLERNRPASPKCALRSLEDFERAESEFVMCTEMDEIEIIQPPWDCIPNLIDFGIRRGLDVQIPSDFDIVEYLLRMQTFF